MTAVVIAMFAASSWFLAGAYEMWIVFKRFRDEGVTTTGVVSSSFPGIVVRGRDAEGEPPETEYRFKTPDGAEHTGGTSGEYFEEGETVAIEYLPADPYFNRIAGSRSTIVRVRERIAMAIIIAFVGVVVLRPAINGCTADSDE